MEQGPRVQVQARVLPVRARGAAAAGHGAPPAATPGAPASQSPASAYAASASVGPDPRKPPQSRPGAYTLNQILDLARAKNPTFLAAEQNLQAVHAQEIQAGVRTNPYFTLYGTNVTEGPDASTPYAISAQVSRLFERGEKRRWRLDAAHATTAQTEAQFEDTIRLTALTLRTAFTHMLIAKEALELAQASLKDFQHEVEIGKDRYDAGDLGKLDYERLDLQLGAFESDEANSRIALQQASAQLQTLTGAPAISVDFDITGPIIPPPVLQTEDALQQLALANRPDYAAARYAIEVAQANTRLAIAQGTTDPTLEAEYDPQRQRELRRRVRQHSLAPLRSQPGQPGHHPLRGDGHAVYRHPPHATRSCPMSTRHGPATCNRSASPTVSPSTTSTSRPTCFRSRSSHSTTAGCRSLDYLDALRGARLSTSDALNAYQQTWLAIHQLSAATNQNVAP